MNTQRTPRIRTRWPVHSLALIPPVALAVGLLTAYGSVPDPMPIHWGADGTPDSWVGRSLPLLMVIALGAPVVGVLGLYIAAVGVASQGGGLPLGDSERSRNDALNTWAHAEAVQTPLAWSNVALSASLTLTFTGLAGPWSWAGGGLVAIGGLGALATLIALMLVTGRVSRAIDLRYPSPSGRRNRWLVFVDAPGGGVIAQNNRGKYTLNMATTTGRVLTVVVAAVAVVVVVERVTGALAAAV